MCPTTQAARSNAPPELPRSSGPIGAAERRLADIVSVHMTLSRIIQAVETGRLWTGPGKLGRLRECRAALEEMSADLERELEKLRRHERSVAR